MPADTPWTILKDYSDPAAEALVTSENSLECNRKDEKGKPALEKIRDHVKELGIISGEHNGKRISHTSPPDDILDFLNKQKAEYIDELKEFKKHCEEDKAGEACISSRLIRKKRFLAVRAASPRNTC